MTRTILATIVLLLSLPACNTPEGSASAGTSSISQKKSTEVFELEHADALELEKIVADFAPSAAVTADARSNSLTVEATNARMNQIKNLIRTLDQGR